MRNRCEQAGIPTKRQTKKSKLIDLRFVENIESLMIASIVDATDRPRWDAIRQLRNIASHPDSQTILAPGATIGLLVSAAELLNSLF